MLQEPYDSAVPGDAGHGRRRDSTAKIDEILKAIEKIQEAKNAGQIRRFTGNDYTTDLAKGNVWVAVAYSGDLVQLQADNPDLRVHLPQGGRHVVHRQHDDARSTAAHPYARRDDDELLLRA